VTSKSDAFNSNDSVDAVGSVDAFNSVDAFGSVDAFDSVDSVDAFGSFRSQVRKIQQITSCKLGKELIDKISFSEM
jgi:hypothetical protein